MTSTEKTNTIFIWCLFLLTPFVSLFVSLKNIRSSWAKNIIWAFTVYFGFTFTIASDTQESDINRYIYWFHDMRTSLANFEDFKSRLYVDENYADILQPALTFIVSRFTDNPAYLIGTFGLVFGYFYSRNLWFVIERLKPSLDGRILFLLLVLALIVPIWSINGFRFWTATHIFLYGALPLIFERKKRYIIPVLLTIFVHFSFILPVAIFLMFFVLGNRYKIYFYLFLATMFVTEINLAPVDSAISALLPDIFVTRSEGYISEDKAEQLANLGPDTRNWYVAFNTMALQWTIWALLIYIYLKGKSVWLQDKGMLALFSFVLYFYAIANILNVIPSGVRFTRIANFFALTAIIFYYARTLKDRGFTKLFSYSLPFQMFFLIVSMRSAFSYFGLVTIAGNPITAFFVPSEITLIDLIK